jgi:hypothetical protein
MAESSTKGSQVTTLIVALIGVNAALLIWHGRYKHGVVGLLSLSFIILGALTMTLVEFVTMHAEYVAPAELLFVLGGCAVFMLRHTYNWWRRKDHARKA